METKSRYEVISELEGKKRDLILEKNSLGDNLKSTELKLKNLKRTKDDNIMVLDRQIEDLEEELSNMISTSEEKKETIDELIKSVDDSLARFGKLLSKKE